LGLAISVGFAQVRQVYYGNILDANYRIGSGGQNNTVPGGVGGVNSQLYVTGQVTGLGAFAGEVGYFAPNQLYLNLPSAGLSTFRRQSVGLQDVLTAPTYTTNPYYDRSMTVLSTPGIVSGMSMPGSNVPRPSPTATMSDSYIEAIQAYEPIAPSMIVEDGRGPSSITPPGAPRSVRAGDSTAESVGRWGEEADFKSLSLEERLRSIEESDRKIDERLQQLLKKPDASTRVEAGIDASSQTLLDNRADQIRPRIDLAVPGSPEEPQPPSTEIPQEYTGNQDIFLDILVQMRKLQEQQDAESLKSSRTKADQTNQFPHESPSRQDTNGPPAKQPPTGSLVEREPGSLIVPSLAGEGEDRFNTYMNSAQQKLKEGLFYDAAIEYEQAAIFDGQNPLPLVGAGLAYLSVGEPLTAAVRIRNAVRMFPSLIETRLDIPSMMDAEIIRSQLVLLSERMDAFDEDFQPLLVFLAAFMHKNLEDAELARDYADRLLTLAGDDPVYTALAKTILTGSDCPDRPE